MIEEKQKNDYWMSEFEFDPDSSARIVKAIRSNAASLKDVANFVEMLAPLSNIYTPDGVVNRLRKMFRRVTGDY